MNTNEYVLSYTENNTEGKQYFFTDINIPVMEIYATSKEEAIMYAVETLLNEEKESVNV